MGKIVNKQGLNTVTFQMKAEHFEILESIATQRQQTPDLVAQDIVQGWMLVTWENIKKDLLLSKVQN